MSIKPEIAHLHGIEVRPLLPGTAGNLVLITSRRHLTALEDTQAISLDTLAPDAAADLLIQVASRPGLSADQPAVREITYLCGYLPLAIGILARQLHHHPSWTAAELAADLAATRGDRSAECEPRALSVAAAFDLSYQELTDDQQRLFRRLGLHPGPDIDDYSTAALDSNDLATTRRNLADLYYDHYLLTEPARGRYRMHDLIGEHAKALAINDAEADRQAAVNRLMEYYLQTALAADRYQVRRTPTGNPSASGIRPAHLPALTDREHAVRWMNAERFNLHAAVNYAATHDKPQYAIATATAMHGFLRSEGYWNQALTLYGTALDVARQTEDQLAQAGALTDLGDMQTLSGDYQTAIGSHEEALRLYRSLGHQFGEANALNKLATVQQAAGKNSATNNLTRALELHHSLGDQLGEANDLNQLGIVQYETGDYPAATASHERALKLRRLIGDSLGEANALYRLGSVQYSTGNYRAAAVSLTQALALDRDVGYRFGEATALVRLGQLRQATGDYQAAATAQKQALELHRSLGYPRGEADALNNLGLIHQAAGDQRRAATNHNRALEIYRSIGFPLGEAEALNGLGELSLAATSSADALSYHEQALAIAKGVTSLPEEARALEGIGRCRIQSGRTTEATTLLRQSLAIYQRIGSPSVQRVEAVIRELDT